jgi:signal transduction histidine kinase
MKEHFMPIFVLISFSIAISIFMVGYASVRGKGKPVIKSFLGVQYPLLIWSVSDLLLLLVGFKQLQFISGLRWIACCYYGIAWLFLCLQYVESPWLTRRNNYILMILPTISCGIALINDLHQWFFIIDAPSPYRFGIIFYAHAIGSYPYILAGAALLVNHAFKHNKHLPQQAFLLLNAVTVPVVFNILLVFRTIKYEYFNLTALCYNFASLLLMIGIFRYKLVDIIPIALRKIVDHMVEAIIVLDNTNRIIEFNCAFRETFPELATAKAGDSSLILIELLQRRGLDYNPAEHKWLRISTEGVIKEEMYLKNTQQCFIVNIRPIWSGRTVLGRIISFNDISAYKALLEEISNKNSELIVLNRQLKEYAATVGELVVTKERNRLARDIHDTLGQTMTVVVMLLQVCKQLYRTHPETVAAKLEEAYQFIVRGQEEARRVLYGLAPLLTENRQLTDILRSLAADLWTSGIGLEFTLEGAEYALERVSYETCYRLFQEACTNAIRHGEARNIRVDLKYTETGITIVIEDDGKGCSTIEKGLGISGMEQRIRAINGSIAFRTDWERGFGITVKLPKTVTETLLT